jgi:fatty-acid peroxygenase
MTTTISDDVHGPIDAPHLKTIDASIALLRDGYEFIRKHSRELHGDVFRARLLGKSAVFMTGPGAPELFYDSERFARSGAVPWMIQKTLFGRDGVQTLDGTEHHERKALFMSLMTRDELVRFDEIAASEWQRAIESWQTRRRVVLFDEALLVLCRAACRWSGIVVAEGALAPLANDCRAMVDGFATLGPRALRAIAGRARAERWARGMIDAVRTGKRTAAPGTALQVFAERQTASGQRLSLDVAAVELLNIIRPISAISWWVAFAALALAQQPAYRQRLASDDAFVEPFVHEVRRFYPFTPFLGARARHDFEWRKVRFRSGELAILDVYGTLHDARLWQRPDEFWPERFEGGTPASFDFIPNGGGDFASGHRCAGEWLTVAALARSIRVLTRQVRYELPPQNLAFSLSRVPSRPASGVVLERVRPESRALASFEKI